MAALTKCRFLRLNVKIHSKIVNRNYCVRVRFAPSPTGSLHLGSLRTALFNYLFARANNGKFVLRIEDTDEKRIVAGAMDKTIDILQWSGIVPDEGPGFGGEHGPYIQTQRLELYKKHSDMLLQNGAAYRCFCSESRLGILRRDQTKRKEPVRYDNKCRHLTNDEIEEKMKENAPFVVRLKLPDADETWEDMVTGPSSMNLSLCEGDPVLMKRNNRPTYHLANVVDDHLMEITHVLRGTEWFGSTPKHLILFRAFGWTPPKYGHLPLIMNKFGKKLSKRDNDVHVEEYKDLDGTAVNAQDMPSPKFQDTNKKSNSKNCEPAGASNVEDLGAAVGESEKTVDPQMLKVKLDPCEIKRVACSEDEENMHYSPGAIVKYITVCGGGFEGNVLTEPDTLEDLAKKFSVERIRTSGARLNPDLLDKVSQVYLVKETEQRKDEIIKKTQDIVTKFLEERYGDISMFKEVLTDDYVGEILQWSKDDHRISRITDLIQEEFLFLWTLPSEKDLENISQSSEKLHHVIKRIIEFIESKNAGENWTFELKEVLKAENLSHRKTLPLIRRVLTGLESGPPIWEIVRVIGKDAATKRLKRYLNKNASAA